MKQLLEDIRLRLKNDRKVWAVAAFFIIVIVLFMMTNSEGRKARPGRVMDEVSRQTVGQGEAYSDLLAAFKQDQDNLIVDARQAREELERTKNELKSSQEKTTGVIEMLITRMESQEAELQRLRQEAAAGPAPTADGAMIDTALPQEPDTVVAFGMQKAPIPPPPAPPVQVKTTFISPGDTTKVRLLSGVAAPTDGTPYPVVFKLLGPISGPDGSALDLGEARIVAAAQGSETDARVIFRLTDLAYRNSDGRRTVVKVDGWVVGEDGIRGMKGKVIDKLGQVILATMGYSAAAAYAQILDDQANNVSVENSDNALVIDSSDAEVIAGSAIGDGAQRLTQILLDKYEKYVPVVEVNSGREVGAVFARGAEVSVYDEEEDNAGSSIID